MRHTGTLILGLTLVLTGCGAGSRSNSPYVPGTTGYSDTVTGAEYVHGGDFRVEEAILQEPVTQEPAPQPVSGPVEVITPAPETPAPVQLVLRERLKEFEITRYAEGVTEPSRFGGSRFRIKFFQKEAHTAAFEGRFTQGQHEGRPVLLVSAQSGSSQLSGYIEDLQVQQQSKGEFTITHGGESAQIFYWAYRARMNIREDREAPVTEGSDIASQIDDLRHNSFGWVHNWNVVRGRSFYLVDFVRIASSGQPMAQLPTLSFKGESLRTGGETVHPAQVVEGQAAQVALVGNSEESETPGGRIFSVTLEDREHPEQTSEVMIDLDIDPEPPAVTSLRPRARPPVETPAEPTLPAQSPLAPHVSLRPRARPDNLRAQTQSEQPYVAGDAYLRIDNSQPRTAIMTRHFERNRNLHGVVDTIAEYKKSTRRGWGGELTAFYKHANPFRQLIETVARTFDVSPAFAYLTVIESRYFYGGEYQIQGNAASSAYGPFQLLTGTASEVGMRSSERGYFAPSACGAARYVRSAVDRFKDSDATLAILAYFQGPYAQVLNLARRYGYTYVEMNEKSAGLTRTMKTYVNRKLAVYFISNDMQAYGFSVPSDAKTSLRQLSTRARGTVMPSEPLRDSRCSSGVSPVL